MIRFTTICILLLAATLAATDSYGQPPFGRDGGDRGGGDRGDRGRGDRDRGRGGFDPSSFLDRLDRNGNGVLDPDEQEGPAQFLIRRLESMDSSIKAGRPIPIRKIKDGFAKMRGEAPDPSDRNRKGDDRRKPQADGADGNQALEVELLVPGFGNEALPERLMGFGATAELMTAEVTDADRAEARKRMNYFDKNKDGFLTKNELTSQFAGNPLDFDQNRDGRLSGDELAVRYARRREGKEEAKRERKSKPKKKKRDNSSHASEVTDPFNGRKSYRSMTPRSAPEGVPGFFTERDQNQDGQISMAEFVDEWNDDELHRFFEFDFNQDGVITSDEAIRCVEEGPAKQASGGPSNSAAPLVPAPSKGEPVDPKYLSVAKRIISRRDKNEDGMLTISEWKTMLMSPSAADANKDGKITAEEYARWTLSRESKR